MNIVCLKGTEQRLYELVAPLVMNPAVIRQNNGYPFKTSQRYVWFVALENDAVVGFLPVKKSDSGNLIDNYYIKGDDADIIGGLLGYVVEILKEEAPLTALVHKRHVDAFARQGFCTGKVWKNYDKMVYQTSEGDGQTT